MGFGLGDIASIIAGPIGSIIGNPGSSSGYGTNGLIGDAINDITGQSSSARQQYRHNLALQKNAQQFAKWQMGNSHQMEVKDLQDAGLNPVLSAGGTGADAGGVAPSTTGAGASGHDPFGMVMNAIGALNSARMTDAQVKNLDTQSNLNEETSAKTHEEKEILKIQKQYIAPLQQSIIDYNNANTAKSKQETLTEIERTALVNAQEYGQTLDNQTKEWDNEKRGFYFQKEMDLYGRVLAKELITGGIESSAAYQITDHIMSEVGKVFNVGINFSHANVHSNANVHSTANVNSKVHSTSKSTSTVNSHNLDYNPTPHGKIGF